MISKNVTHRGKKDLEHIKIICEMSMHWQMMSNNDTGLTKQLCDLSYWVIVISNNIYFHLPMLVAHTYAYVLLLSKLSSC